VPPLPTAGLGFKPQHAPDALQCTAPGMWFEVHPENYMVDGGPRAALLEAVAGRFPVSFHSVSLSLAGTSRPDHRHLARLRRLIERIEPVRVSEHLAWSSAGGYYLPDLLPFPRTHAALARIVDNISHTQDVLGRPISLENPSHYTTIVGHDWDEPDFLAELVRRTGCGLLLDINNVYVSACNVGIDARAYLKAFPAHAVTEIHVAGHHQDEAVPGLVIDSHDRPVADEVWALFASALEHTGAVPTLIERDGHVPAFDALLEEWQIAASLLHANRAKHT
jgi:uncharacterized protein